MTLVFCLAGTGQAGEPAKPNPSASPPAAAPHSVAPAFGPDAPPVELAPPFDPAAPVPPDVKPGKGLPVAPAIPPYALDAAPDPATRPSLQEWAAKAVARTKACTLPTKASPVAQAKVVESIAACKANYDQPVPQSTGPMLMAASSGCPAQGTPLATYDAAAHLAMSSPFSLQAGSVITVWTQNLAVLPAPLTGSSPDTLLYLLRCADSRCTTGTVVAVDDDDNPSPQALDSWLQYTVPQSGSFRWLVTDWRQGNEGSCDVYVQIDAGAPVPVSGQVFGGYHHFAYGLAPGDALLVGKNNNTAALVAPGASPAHPALQADPEYADTMVFAFTSTVTNCDSGNCAVDKLRDVDEVGRITALSKQGIRRGSQDAYAIYADVFNGTSAPFNYAGWPVVQVTSQNLLVNQGTYTRNFCAQNSDCNTPTNPSGLCRFDGCSSASTCRNPALSCAGTGACTCNTDDDCWSGRCVGSGSSKVCALGVGTCGCSTPSASGECSAVSGEAACQGPPSVQLPACTRSRDADALGPSDYKMWESAQFGNNNTASWIRVDGSTGTPLTSIAQAEDFAVHLDFYWDGFQVGENRVVLLDLGIAWLTIENDSQGLPRVVGRLVYPGAPANTALVSVAPVETRRWYRIAWVVTDWQGGDGATRHWLDVWPRNRATGWFNMPGDENCVWRKLGPTLNLPAPSEARFGAPIDGMGEFFRGRIDNIALFNSSYLQTKPSPCTELTGGVP